MEHIAKCGFSTNESDTSPRDGAARRTQLRARFRPPRVIDKEAQSRIQKIELNTNKRHFHTTTRFWPILLGRDTVCVVEQPAHLYVSGLSLMVWCIRRCCSTTTHTHNKHTASIPSNVFSVFQCGADYISTYTFRLWLRLAPVRNYLWRQYCVFVATRRAWS